VEERLYKMPIIGGLLNIIDHYPRLSAWVVLSAGVLGLLFYEARDVGLTTRNWIALGVASIVVSGLCIWIVSWEDEEALEAETTPSVPTEDKSPNSSA
jgi:hypothetical protein